MSLLNITNEDNMELMARYPDKYFDLAIVDPPYGKKPTRNADGLGVCKRTFESGSDDWDIKPSKEYFNELFRVSKNQVIWGGNYFMENLYSTNCFLIWDKNKTFGAFAECEMAWTSLKDVARIYKYTWNGMIQQDMKNKENRIHPTQKPVALYKWILDKYAKQGYKIIDTHLGSGSIAIACHDLGFDLTACELDTNYFNSAIKRIEEHKKQLKLL